MVALRAAFPGTRPLHHSLAQTRIARSRSRLQIRCFAAADSASPGNGNPEQSSSKNQSDDFKDERRRYKQDPPEPNLRSKMLEAAATALASILVVGTGFALGGYCYHNFYKWLVLHKMGKAFLPGDPVLELAAMGKELPKTLQAKLHGVFTDTEGDDDSINDEEEHWVLRKEQARIDDIISGREKGHYHLLIGEKGTGKSSMLLDAMAKIQGEGVSMFEAHADLEIFRVRLGKALNFEFHEDYIGSYFSEKGPRDGSALLDIERAFNKLEKIALKRRKKVGRPLVVIINSIHMIRDDEDGKDLLELLQQRAEQWAASSLVTMIFNSDDYWVYERLKKLSTRMTVHTISDLPKDQAISALQRYRKRYFGDDPTDSAILSEVYRRVGGRLTFLNRVARSRDMLSTCDRITEVEKQWFLNNAGILGMEMDDDVMDQQKYASAAMVLARALVNKEKEMEMTFDTESGHILPEIPLHEARQIMTRADFDRAYDHLNLFTITSRAKVRADSVPMQRAFRAICAQPGFDKYLEDTLQRISDIESLGRTREIVAKDLVGGGKYRIKGMEGGIFGRGGKTVEIEVVEPPAEEDDDDSQEKKE